MPEFFPLFPVNSRFHTVPIPKMLNPNDRFGFRLFDYLTIRF